MEVSTPVEDAPTLGAALGQLETELGRLRSAADQIETSKQAATEAVRAAGQVGGAAAALAGPTAMLVDRLDRVDFPARLDKLDAAIATLGVSVQNTQARVNAVETTLRGEVARAAEQAERRAADTERAAVTRAEAAQTSAGQLRTLAFVALGLLVVLVVLAFVR